ncbi:MAG: D-alanyl-D-alanine carboxypeptidase/D-alanyl-D-alanine-endopeptidase [Myxococcota bacterium]
MLKNILILCAFLANGYIQAAVVGFNSILYKFKGAQVGFLAMSSKSHQIIAEHNPNMLLNPASNVKLVTTLAALELLHPEYRFKTDYYATGPVEHGVLNGNLVIKGYGDPSISNERLQSVIRRLKLVGVESIRGELILDDSFFGGEGNPPGWASEQYSQKIYTAPIGALSLNHNTVSVFIRPAEVGEPAIVVTDPPVDYFKTKGFIKTTAKGRRPIVGSKDDGLRTEIILNGGIAVGSRPLVVRKKVYQPSRYFASVFKYFLRQEGIALLGEQYGAGSRRLILTDTSPMLSQLVAETNKSSSNFLAEMLVKAIAGQVSEPARFAVGIEQITKFLEQKVGFKKGSFILSNGSGLGTTNRFTARQFVKLLEYAQKNFELSSEFMASLGVAGTQGTLSRRMRQEPTLRSLRAKTGTLRDVSSLSGYVETRGDDPVIFSILVQGKPRVLCRARWFEDRIGNYLANLHTDVEPCISIEEDTIPDDEAIEEEMDNLVGG